MSVAFQECEIKIMADLTQVKDDPTEFSLDNYPEDVLRHIIPYTGPPIRLRFISQSWNRIVVEHLRKYTRTIPYMKISVNDDERLIITAHIPKDHLKILGLNKWKMERKSNLACSPPQSIFTTERSEQQKVESARYRVKKFFESISEVKELYFWNVNEATIKIILELMGTVRIKYASACVKNVHEDSVRYAIGEACAKHELRTYGISTLYEPTRNW